MGVLDSVMQYKARKDAEQAQAANAIPQAVQAFIQGRQQQVENQNSLLKNQIDAAKAGFRIEGGQLVQDPSLMDAAQKNVLTIDDQGNLKVAGQVGKRDIVRSLPESVDQAAAKARARGDESVKTAKMKATVPTAEMKNLRQQSINALASVESLEQLAQKIPGGYQGMVDLAKGTVSRGKTSPELRSYLKEVKAAAAQIYRAKTGDTRLSDEDAASRAYPLLWNPTEDESVKSLSFKRLKEDINTKISLYEDAFLTGSAQEEQTKSVPMPTKSKAPKGAKGWDTEKGDWVF